MVRAVQPLDSESRRLRTCIASRIAQDDSQLLRVVVDPKNPSAVLPDPQRRLPGRGAWITPTLQALDIAEQRKAFGRAFRVSRNLDAGPVREYITALGAGPDR